MKAIATSLFAVVLSTGSFAATVQVGNCLPKLVNYATISLAVSGVPAGSTIDVCPGTYSEQVQITQPLTLQGISSANSALPVLSPPQGGLTQTTTNEAGQTVAYQLLINNAPGPVKVSNITIDGTGNNVQCSFSGGGVTWLAGIFYLNSSGTVNRMTIRNQKGNGCGIGVYVDVNSAQSVTITNSNIHDVDDIGIESNADTTITSNDVNLSGVPVDQNFGSPTGIFQPGGTDKIIGNSILGGYIGIETSAGSVSGNTIVDSVTGIEVIGNSALSVTSNKIILPVTYGVFIIGSSTVSVVGNNIMSVQGNGGRPGAIGIEFNCTANSSVHSNTINEAGTGVDQVPTAVSTNNSYTNVGTISTGGCP